MFRPSPAARRQALVVALLAGSACGLPAAAQPAEPAAPQSVEIRGRRALDAPAEPGSVLRGDRLGQRLESTLGATLQGELGTANASFGPSVGLPLIRGQGGSRVRAMLGGLGVHDASTVSADHGVMVEPGLAESITVWRGPATIRFGGGAIGGAVEVEEGRLPMQPRERPEVRGLLRGGSGDSALAVLRVDTPLAAELVGHADLHARRQGYTPIHGPAIDEDAVRRQFQLVNAENTVGRIANSQARVHGGSLGLGTGRDGWRVGALASHLQQDYGIPPGGHSHAHAPAPGEPSRPAADVRIRARQNRYELRAEGPLAFGPPGVRWQLRAAHVRYAHDEDEGGRLSTTFRNTVSEARLELELPALAGGQATLGAQAQGRVFSALGEEAFVPQTRIEGGALFALQRWQAAPWRFELGLRADWQRLQPEGPFLVLGQARQFPARRFWPHSASAALQRDYGSAARAGRVTLTHWQVGRAPDVQELYAAGPHLATRSFDFGNSSLGVESLHAWDLAWVHRHDAWQWRGNAFAYRSGGYIYQRSLGWFYEAEEGQPQAVCARLDHCLPATKREQAAAQFHGYEAELSRDGQALGGTWRVALFSDLTRGRLAGGHAVPRLPPQRAGLALEMAAGAWSAQTRLTRARAQSRPGENETPTAGYTRIDAGLRWRRADAEQPPLSVFVVLRNLGDRPIRNSTSFLRNYAPEPGRSWELGLEAAL